MLVQSRSRHGAGAAKGAVKTHSVVSSVSRKDKYWRLVLDSLRVERAIGTCAGYLVFVGLMAGLTVFAGAPADSVPHGTVLKQKKTAGVIEEFNSLNNWESQDFRKGQRPTRYEIIAAGHDGHALQCSTDASASPLICRTRFDPYRLPVLRWRWKVAGVYAHGNATTKKGDDFPIRIYIIFPYQAKRTGLFLRLKYALYKKRYGVYPPDSVLDYVWANRAPIGKPAPSPYTSRVRVIPMESGAARAGQWRTEEANILHDYRRVFGHDPPREEVALTVMADSDNTGEKGTSWVDFIEVLPAVAGE